MNNKKINLNSNFVINAFDMEGNKSSFIQIKQLNRNDFSTDDIINILNDLNIDFNSDWSISINDWIELFKEDHETYTIMNFVRNTKSGLPMGYSVNDSEYIKGIKNEAIDIVANPGRVIERLMKIVEKQNDLSNELEQRINNIINNNLENDRFLNTYDMSERF